MKNWDDLTLDERRDRLGDDAINRRDNAAALDAECARRLLRGERMTNWMKKRARTAITSVVER